MEESYGCLAGTYARDKDACVAVMMLCEVAAYYKTQGKTLCDAMEEGNSPFAAFSRSIYSAISAPDIFPVKLTYKRY